MRNLTVLTICQALGSFGSVTVVLLTGIIGAELAPTPVLATLPASLSVIGLAATSFPAALFMRAVGRKLAFQLAALWATAGALLAALGIEHGQFVWFCLGALMLGCNWAFIQQYRFAAAESVPSDYVSRAVSWVMVGTLAAALLAPRLAVSAADLLETKYTGSFVALAVVMFLSALVMFGFRNVNHEDSAGSVDAADARRTPLLRRPTFLIAVAAGMVGYGVMSLVMTAAPVSMHVHDGHSLETTAFVIQSHIVAMYVPSFFSGHLIARFGARSILLAGTIALAISALTAWFGHTAAVYWVTLVLLGVGWNFLFVGGTTLLTLSYEPRERFRAQAVNEVSVFSIMAAASLGAGALIHYTRWEVLNGLTWVPLAFMLLALLWVRLPAQREMAKA